jgi:hypothetical protein
MCRIAKDLELVKFSSTLFAMMFLVLEQLVKCHNPSLGLATKARACKVAGQEEARESLFMFSGVQKCVRD